MTESFCHSLSTRKNGTKTNDLFSNGLFKDFGVRRFDFFFATSKAVIRACGQAAVWQQSLQMLFELTTSNLEATGGGEFVWSGVVIKVSSLVVLSSTIVETTTYSS